VFIFLRPQTAGKIIGCFIGVSYFPGSACDLVLIDDLFASCSVYNFVDDI